MTETNLIETEIGLFPDSWSVEPLGKICEKPTYGFTDSASKVGNAKFLRITDITENGVDWEAVPYCNCPVNKLNNYLLKDGDIVFARIGATTGKSYIINNPPVAVYASYLIRVRTKDEINPLFLYFFFQSKEYWKQVDANKKSNLKQGVNGSILQKLLIPKPEKDEQDSIANIISLIQSAIQKQEQIINTTIELKNALMKKLFTEGMNSEPLKETEIGLIPESWVVVKIGSFGKCVTGTTPKTSVIEYYENPQYDFIAPADIGETKFVYNSLKQISEAGINVVRHLPPNAVLCVCIGSTIGKVGLTVKEKSATNQQLNSIICNDDYDPQFIYYLLNYYSGYWRTFSTPSPVPILSKGTFEQIDIRATKNKEEQTSIVKTLSACDAKIEFHKNKKQTLKTLFSSCLHQLMTGKVRVKDAEKKVVQEVN